MKQEKNSVATKEFVKDELHRLELQTYKAIFWSSLLQVLAILWGLIAIIRFMVAK
jgi:hypothetical protein